MKQIITIAREFGSGGRELAKRLAENLGFKYYDKDAIAAIAKHNSFDEKYLVPYTTGRSFAFYSAAQKMATDALLQERRIILEIAKQGNCVIVGRGADIILRDYHPLNIFVYADLEHRLQRCIDNAPAGENLTPKQLTHKLKEVDQARAKHYLLLGADYWGRKENYQLCLNSGGLTVKEIVPAVAAYAKVWFKEQ